MDFHDIMMETSDSQTAFQRGTPMRRGIRLRKTSSNSKLPINSRLLMKRVQRQQFCDQIANVSLEQVYDAIAPNPVEELNESFYIDEDDVRLLPTHRASKRSLLGKASSNLSKVIKGKGQQVAKKNKTRQLKAKVRKAFTAIDKFFSK